MFSFSLYWNTALALKPGVLLFFILIPLYALPRKLLFSFSSLYLFTYSIIYCVVCGYMNGETCCRAHEEARGRLSPYRCWELDSSLTASTFTHWAISSVATFSSSRSDFYILLLFSVISCITTSWGFFREWDCEGKVGGLFCFCCFIFLRQGLSL